MAGCGHRPYYGLISGRRQIPGIEPHQLARSGHLCRKAEEALRNRSGRRITLTSSSPCLNKKMDLLYNDTANPLASTGNTTAPPPLSEWVSSSLLARSAQAEWPSGVILIHSNQNFTSDISLINSIEAVPSILQVVCNATGMGFAAVARMTEGRWIACSVVDQIDLGLKPGEELKVETTISDKIRQSRQGVIIDHVGEDEINSGHPTLALYGIQSYISMPIILRDGSMFGRLCASDPKPHRLNVPGTVGMFKLFAELIAIHIDSRTGWCRPRPILRTSANRGIARTVRRRPRSRSSQPARFNRRRDTTSKEEAARRPVTGNRRDDAKQRGPDERTNRQCAGFDRARMGGGFKLNRVTETDLAAVLEQVIAEIRLASPECAIEMECKLDEPVDCDRARIAQLFSNLLGNAVRHGDATPRSEFWR